MARVTTARAATSVWFWLILLLAVAVRVHHLTAWDMWTDEVQTLWTSQAGEFKEGPMYRTAPINFLLSRLAILALGPDELGLRIVPFLAGVATVALGFLLLRIWIGRRAALFSALALAASMWHVYWSQTGRHYAIQMLLLLLALHAFLLFWRRQSQIGFWFCVGLLLLALFVHSSSGFYVVALLAFVGVSWFYRTSDGRDVDRTVRRRHVVAGLGLLGVLAIYSPVYLSVARYLVDNKVAWNPPWNIVGSLAFYVPPHLALPALAGVAFLKRERDDLSFFFLCLLVIPMCLAVIASFFTIASAAYSFSALLAVAALVGVTSDRLLRLTEGKFLSLALGILVAGIYFGEAYDLAHYHTFYNGLKPRWRDVAAFVDRESGPGSLVLASEGDVMQYYLGRDRADWFGKYEDRIGTPGSLPRGASDVWYAIYVGDSAINKTSPSALHYLFNETRLAGLFPLHYGAKDRTIAVFHEYAREGAR